MGFFRRLMRPVAHRILPPVTKYYLRKTRRYRYDGLVLQVPPGVFHPGLYFSTRLLARHIRGLNLKGKAVLELGCGSGLLSLLAARAGARVTASDIHGDAVAAARANAARNDLELETVVSDLFTALEERRFDLIVVNPPYYPKDPAAGPDHAWYCGAEFQYFDRLFAGLADHLTTDGEVLMVLSEDCDLARIRAIAAGQGWELQEILRKRMWGEWNFVFLLRP